MRDRRRRLLWLGGDGPGPTPEEQIIALFANGEQGILYMPWLPGTLWQDTAGTVHAGSGDPNPIATMNNAMANLGLVPIVEIYEEDEN